MASSYWSPFWYAGKSSAWGAVNKLRYLESDGLLLSFSGRESLPSPHNNHQVAPSSRLPWSITVHFSEFPAEILLECPARCLSSNSFSPTKYLFPLRSSNNFCREAVESIFMSSLKESDQLKTSGKVWIVKLYLGLNKTRWWSRCRQENTANSG